MEFNNVATMVDPIEENICEDLEYGIDDNTGKFLNTERVRDVRQEDLSDFKSTSVYEYSPRSKWK